MNGVFPNSLPASACPTGTDRAEARRNAFILPVAFRRPIHSTVSIEVCK